MKKLLVSFAVIIASLVLTTVTYANPTPENLKSTVSIQVVDSLGDNYFGTGVVLTEDALILTAAHVILDSTTMRPAEFIDICTIVDANSNPDCKYSGRALAYN